MLELKNVTTEIAGTTILRDVSFSVSKGSMVGLIGRNGAGKTTSLRSIMGLIKPKAGQVLINGEDMTNQGSYERAGMSIGYMPEDRRLVPDLTVEENIMAPAWVRRRLRCQSLQRTR